MEQKDKRLGHITPEGRDYEPEVCAASGRPVRGKHSTQYYLPNGYYCSVLASQERLWTPAKKQELIDLVNGMTIPKTRLEVKREEK